MHRGRWENSTGESFAKQELDSTDSGLDAARTFVLSGLEPFVSNTTELVK
jgi:hypothetical protein